MPLGRLSHSVIDGRKLTPAEREFDRLLNEAESPNTNRCFGRLELAKFLRHYTEEEQDAMAAAIGAKKS